MEFPSIRYLGDDRRDGAFVSQKNCVRLGQQGKSSTGTFHRPKELQEKLYLKRAIK